MQFRFSKQEKDALHRIHLLSGKSYEDVREVYEGFLYSIVLSCLEKEPIYLPFFGEMEIRYIRDSITDDGREAELDITFSPNKFLKRIVGQIEDREESDLERFLKDKIRENLDDLLDERE
jgi:hypothetical protein